MTSTSRAISQGISPGISPGIADDPSSHLAAPIYTGRRTRWSRAHAEQTLDAGYECYDPVDTNVDINAEIDADINADSVDLVEVTGAAFEQFYREQRAGIVRALTVTTGDIDLATESVDEAMVRAYQRWNTVGSFDQPTGWVYRVALNHSRSRLRRVARKMRHASTFARRDEHGTDVPFADRISDARVLQAVQALPVEQRAVLVARVLLGLTEAQTIEALDIRAGTIKSRLHRALVTLRRELPEYAADWNDLDDSAASESTTTDTITPDATTSNATTSSDQEPTL